MMRADGYGDGAGYAHGDGDGYGGRAEQPRATRAILPGCGIGGYMAQSVMLS